MLRQGCIHGAGKHVFEDGSDLLSGILAVPAKLASEIDEPLLNTHLVCFSRHGSNFVYGCIRARSTSDRTKLLCLVFFPESARGPRHLVTRPGPLPLPKKTEFDVPLWLASLDLNKAFDQIEFFLYFKRFPSKACRTTTPTCLLHCMRTRLPQHEGAGHSPSSGE